MAKEFTPIYLDHHATTPVDDNVMAKMVPYFTEKYGNPASDDHVLGVEADKAVKAAREQVSDAINSHPEEIIFTSGATESDNLAIRGAAEYAAEHNYGTHIITTETEHEAVLEVCEDLEDDGFEVTYLSVDDNGRVNLRDVEGAIREDTILLSVMAANNEIGTIAPIAELGAIAKDNQTLFHTDAVQAINYVDIDVEAMDIDLMSISAHKLYGPKGIGALYVRRRRPKVKLNPLIHGGGHERGWRSGTLNVPSIVGMGEAVKMADKNRNTRREYAAQLQHVFWDSITDKLDDVVLNGPPLGEDRLPNNLNVSFIGAENKAIVRKIRPDIAVSAGSACTTGTVEASHVLQALGGNEGHWHSAIRVGLGKDNTEEEIRYAADRITSSVADLRRLSF